MFYLIIGILLLLYYFFVAPASIKGTLNSVTLVLLGVGVIILIVTGIIQIFSLQAEYFVSAALVYLGYLCYRDIENMPPKGMTESEYLPAKRRRFTLKKVLGRR